MPFIDNAGAKRFSDLVVNELDPRVGYARETINVTPPAASGTVKMGTVVFRAKSADPLAAYAVLAGAASLSLDNEYAVVYGDHYGFNEEFVPAAVSTNPVAGNAVAFIRGPVQLKEWYIKQIAQDEDGAALTDVQFNSLKELLAKAGIIVEITLGA